MQQKILWVIVIIVAVLIAVGWFFVLRVPSANDVSEKESNNPSVKTGVVHRIRMKNNEFLPKELAINKGDEVIFENEEDAEHWPASDLHPTHLLCPGFDALEPIQRDGTYSRVFDTKGACPMHDHLWPAMRGKIIVK